MSLVKDNNLIRKINELKVIHFLQTVDSATKNEISAATDLSFPTVGKILADLIVEGEIASHTFDSSHGGRPAERFVVNSLNSLVLSLYLGDDSFEYQISDSLKNVIEDKSVKIHDEKVAMDMLIDFIDKRIKEFPAVKILSIGVPGSINNGQLQFMPKRYKDFDGKNIKKELAARFNLPVLVENDINAITYGQYTRMLPDFKGSSAYFYNGADGIGMGLTINGTLVRGDNGIAGEAGFMPMVNGKNVREAIEMAESEQEIAEVIAYVLATTTCLINPSYFSISGVNITESLIPVIYEQAKKIIPNMPLPKLVAVENIRQLYFYSLVDTALEELYS